MPKAVPRRRRSSASSTSDVGRYHRWCTPSILEDQERVEDFYASDVSISAGFFGTLVDHTGSSARPSASPPTPRAPTGRCSRSTGRAARTGSCCGRWPWSARTRSVLVARSIHHSVINALKAYGLDFRFLPTPYEPRYEALLPPSVEQVAEGLRRAPEAVAVFYTSPTYEGLMRGHARDRRVRARDVADRDGRRRRGVGRAPALPPDAARVGDGGGRRRLRAVDPQARRRAAADGPAALARGPRRHRADGGGLPRVRDHLALLPPARVGRRGGADARGAGRGGARAGDRADRGAEGGAARRRCPTSTGWTTRRGCARFAPTRRDGTS